MCYNNAFNDCMFWLMLFDDLFCFARQSYLQASNLRQCIKLVLVPQSEPGPYCMDGANATAWIEFSTLQTCIQEVNFTYMKDQVIELEFDGAACNFAQLAQIPNAQVRMTLGKVQNYVFTLNQLLFVKDDTRECWKNIDVSFQLAKGKEMFRVDMIPNYCGIPVQTTTALRLLSNDPENGQNTLLPVFARATEPGGYLYDGTYQHMNTYYAELKCSEAGLNENACLQFIQNVSKTLRYWLELRLEYYQQGELLEIQQAASRYLGISSLQCANAVGLKSYLLNEQILLAHDSFGNFEECWAAADKPTQIKFYAQLETVSWIETYANENYSVDSYFLQHYTQIKPIDDHNFVDINQSVLYHMALFLTADGAVQHQFLFQQQVIQQCAYMVIAKLPSDKRVLLEYRNSMKSVCSGSGSQRINVRFYNSQHSLLFDFTYIATLNRSESMNFHSVKTTKSIRKIRKAAKLSQISIVVQGEDFFYAGIEVFNQSWIVEVAIILACAALYLAAGFLWVCLHIRKKDRVGATQ